MISETKISFTSTISKELNYQIIIIFDKIVTDCKDELLIEKGAHLHKYLVWNFKKFKSLINYKILCQP